MLQEGVERYSIDFLAKMQAHNDNNRNTLIAYRNDMRQLCAYLERQGLECWQQVTLDHITAYLLWMRDEQLFRPSTIARKLAACKSLFNYLQTTGMIVENPTAVLKLPQVQKRLPSVVNTDQVCCLFQQINQQTLIGKRDLAMLQLLCATGMRVSELVTLSWYDIDLERAVVRCPGRGRASGERWLPLPDGVVSAVQGYLQEVRPCLIRDEKVVTLFLNHRGGRLTRQGFWLIIKRYAQRAGIDSITPHMLRHSFVVLLLSGALEQRTVQERLRHVHISSITSMYHQLAQTSGQKDCSPQ